MAKMSTRVNFQMDERSLERLKRLKEDIGASSYAEITANSYRLYEFLIGLEKQGKKLIVKSDDSEEVLSLFIPG